MRKIKKQVEKRDRFVQYMQKLLYSNKENRHSLQIKYAVTAVQYVSGCDDF